MYRESVTRGQMNTDLTDKTDESGNEQLRTRASDDCDP